MALVPHSNPAFAIVRDAGGLPFDVATSRLSDIADEVARLLVDEEELRHRGAQARSYAETVFDVESITDIFEGVLKTAHR